VVTPLHLKKILIAVTKKLIDVGDLLGIPLIDHIIIGDGTDYLSLREGGLVSFCTGSQVYLREI
jgi:DNA repair protein RadC